MSQCGVTFLISLYLSFVFASCLRISYKKYENGQNDTKTILRIIICIVLFVFAVSLCFNVKDMLDAEAYFRALEHGVAIDNIYNNPVYIALKKYNYRVAFIYGIKVTAVVFIVTEILGYFIDKDKQKCEKINDEFFLK